MHYTVYHYDGTEQGCFGNFDGAVALCERDRNTDPPDTGRHCVVRDGRIVYWSKRTDNADRKTVRDDFLSEQIISDEVDLLEGPDDLSDQFTCLPGKILDASHIDEEVESLLVGLELDLSIAFRVTTTKGTKVVVVTREESSRFGYSYTIDDSKKLFADSQFKALKFAVKRFRNRTKIERLARMPA